MKKPKGKRKTGRRGKSLPVMFSDRDIIESKWKPPFQDSDGNYADPTFVIAGGEVPADYPRSVACGSTIVIYSSWAEIVAGCQGYKGPGGKNNPVVMQALANAEAVADTIKCDGDCTKRVFGNWQGWSCRPEGTKFVASGAVELLVICREEV